ncbi:hypothetical protein GGQ57_000254 [Parabacteroides faecis]|jgi:hypothetical protein|uniref:Uncharacterized protein n=1 Tax=Parabacteroides faecis TaxID=1217282 RepID=A0ABR6KG07_9BACT|nr:hypothetical protein [Parabacteroides faecis]
MYFNVSIKITYSPTDSLFSGKLFTTFVNVKNKQRLRSIQYSNVNPQYN